MSISAPFARVFRAFSAAAGLEPTQRIKREGSPERQPLPALVRACLLDDVGAVVESQLQEGLVLAGEHVGLLGLLAGREQAAFLPGVDVDAPALDVVRRQPGAQIVARSARHCAEFQELAIEEPEKVVERVGDAAVGRRRKEDEMPVDVGRYLLEEAVTQMRAVVGSDAGVGLVDDDELRAGADELVTADVRLDVVEADDGERMRPENAIRLKERPFEPSGRRRGDGDSGDQEFGRQLLHPLVDEVRRAEDGDAFDLAAVEQFAGDQAALDRLADPDVVGDQEPHGVLLHRHHQRDELVGLGFEHDAARAAERPGAAAEREAEGVAHELRLVLRADAAAVGVREGRRHNRVEFDVGKQRLRVGFGARQRAQVQPVGVRSWQDDPFAAARSDEISRREAGDGVHSASPRASARASIVSGAAGASGS